MSSYTDNTTKTTITQAINEFLLNCEVEGRSAEYAGGRAIAPVF